MSNLYLTCNILYSPVGKENLTKYQLHYVTTWQKYHSLQHLALTTSLLFPIVKTILYGELISLTITTSRCGILNDLCLVNKNS